MARPKAFDTDEALEKAMTLFWRQGYDATSMQELVNEMGINRGSLYDTYGDKHQLFLAAIDKYCQEMVAGWIAAMMEPDAGLETIRSFFKGLELQGTDGSPACGCLLTNSIVELAPHDDEIANRAQAGLKQIEAAFRNALQNALNDGSLHRSKSPRALARFLTSSLQGLAVMVKAGVPAPVLRDSVGVILSVLE